MGFVKELIIAARLRNSEGGGRNFLPWEKTKTIALVLDSKTASSKNAIDKFIYEADKVVDVYYIDIHVKESQIKNFITFSKQEKSFFGLPNGKASAKIVKKKYDVLINAAFSELDYSSVLSNSIKATCKCGFECRADELDMIVKRKEGQDLMKYLDELVNYLKMIRN
ncbi:MAG: hypothetical protein IPJ60_05570 [Sphingobacteriaceae bacterium]|nr:hypothetical protein [Sphingobacteriaceae bacterium]